MTKTPYYIHGRGGRHVIALHGLFDTADYFDGVLAAFDPEQWSVVMPDIRGFGRAIDDQGPFDMKTIAADTLALADRLGWNNFAVVGHSMCGKAALRVAIDGGDRVNAIVGIAPIWAGPALFDESSLAFFHASATDVDKREVIIAQSTGNRLSQHWSRALARRSFERSRVDAYTAYIESFTTDDFEDEAMRLQQNVLVLVGAHDSLTEQTVRRTWGTKLQSSQISVLADCGHWPMVEAPLLAGSMIERFLASVLSGTSHAALER
ncbi:alpha/beta hydrolase [Burkholderia multivorans]|uniref:alpha/beta fold hydrolase n=1 Tax=Burkholderia cepacia complex TaxID=87882 RepID=UPI00123C6454|nr:MULTISPECIES: alpha/beta hydrolase [Burkholderia cepacia complex]QET31296.1 alpha/beta hydrolase [Burkholderia multivorans]QET41286.1 alpha/beta hydrolase [Burkholderia multivorans]UQN70213.1 alpha/beta hydrolase [Burkholderia multivorans]UQN75942.1 alpha/beta hydrolase [Burkholderia multivorans]